VTMRAATIAAVFVGVGGPVIAETLTCATSFQGYRVCQGADGYRSTEWQWQDQTIGQDSDGNRPSTSRWQGRETTTVWPRSER
jgi:hypothetical protein